MKFKGKKLFELLDGIKAVSELTEPTGKFAYGVAKNRRIVQKETETIEETREWSKEYMEFEKARIELIEKMAKKDKDGNPIKMPTDNKGGYVFQLESQTLAEKKVEELKKTKEFKKVCDEQKAKDEAYDNLLKQEFEIELFMIDDEFVPKEITPNQRFGILDLIKEK